MLTVTIAINGRTLIHRMAVNKTKACDHDPLKPDIYAIDDGRKIAHVRSAGAAELAVKMLLGVHEVDLDEADLNSFLTLHRATRAPRKINPTKQKKSK